jgi:hypothetical protein
MKNFFIILVVAGFLTACNNSADESGLSDSARKSNTAVASDTIQPGTDSANSKTTITATADSAAK